MTKIDLITRNLIEHLLVQIEKSSSIFILTSFVMKSGVEVLNESLRRAAERGADIKICTGDYLFVTQPDALKNLIGIHKNIEVRLWRSNGTSFHPKSYIFQNGNEGVLVVGSSNLSRSALTSGIEWNLAVDSSNKNHTFLKAIDQFSYHFLHENTVSVNPEIVKLYQNEYEKYHQKNPSLVNTWTQLEELDLMLPSQKHKIEADNIKEETVAYGDIKPRFAQVEALEELEKTLEEEYSSALVVMATGLGKTYLAGFFARHFQRVLFIAHREEILYQAQNSFKNILPNRKSGIFNGNSKEREADLVFASIYTLCMKHHLEAFSIDEFDLIIVDEFHHAAADSYQRVINYFNPVFLLGITATPDRNDNKDVYAICKGNVAYRIDFLEAIQRQWLAPFSYYGVYDETDYSQITWLGSKYAEDELLKVQLRKETADNILRSWEKYKKTRTIVFCSSIKQAEFLATYFNNHGYRTVALHSQQQSIGRKQAISMLKDSELDAIFTVDLFNEGVDIPSVDTLLFVRPTESLTVFTQQIGRGLRLHSEKDYCVVIDLIGNYRNADVKLSLFDIKNDDKKNTKNNIHPTIPETCSINLDVEVIDLLSELVNKREPRKEKLLYSYMDLKITLGIRPTYLDLHLKGQADASQYRSEFKSFAGFLYWADELSEREKETYKRYEPWLIEVEKTGMAKSYKMVVLLAMLSRGDNKWFKPITPEEVAPFFHRYLTEKEYRKNIDFSDGETKRLWDYDEAKVAKLIAKMPMTKWSGSSKGLVNFSDNQFFIAFDVLEEDLETIYKWTMEICKYRLHYHFERKAQRREES
ncbi:DEAD/DEAH box helicase family protein [Bacillus sp. REN16]|uniref:DEAD/DEAH box helicase family protein n=1 Tax=Bacillus sp. REN16 TaxID=2887296 RepID=UPI001E4C79A7|nr:DEAD/DEAH box helicase family protein [Bacillus sp. REN16]MCC3357738.1 DEAD/DEAH box helicase family protein [Bacillus sp. REN16]